MTCPCQFRLFILQSPHSLPVCEFFLVQWPWLVSFLQNPFFTPIKCFLPPARQVYLCFPPYLVNVCFLSIFCHLQTSFPLSWDADCKTFLILSSLGFGCYIYSTSAFVHILNLFTILICLTYGVFCSSQGSHYPSSSALLFIFLLFSQYLRLHPFSLTPNLFF